ncbi:MAG TPA: permease [Chryseolinea sp.]|nr:permease [Chryseolinea sp.]HPH46101.1 permease [Chryseolinea sp.]HPM29572.1 permease [Chryseolinea sp.]
MSPAISKTVYLIMIIAIGYLMRKKFSTKDHKDGIKTIILSLALPATIFIALLKIEFSIEMILVPLLAIAFNLILFFLIDKLPLHSILNIPEKQHRALSLLIPSLAPGLSCFPFIAEYSGEGSLALAALGDVGNKLFVLVIAYMIAMRWYFNVNNIANTSKRSKVKDLLRALVEEPVNLVIITAIIMLAMGINFSSLPVFAQMSIDKISLIMTPLVLLFIGISMKLTMEQVRTIFTFLFLRSGLAFLISGILLLILPVKDLATTLLIVVFPQSACSFWPYAHMAAISKLERKTSEHDRTFDLDFAMNILACSLPFSVILILTVYSSGEFFTSPVSNIGAGIFSLLLGTLPIMLSIKKSSRERLSFTSKIE